MFRNSQYPNRKDWIKPLRKSKAFDKTCRCNGSCNYCRENRDHSTNQRIQSSKAKYKEWENE